ncbi:MAG: SMI1/KNR4 family protein [Planctomycetes bacterium]|nr:SMI1/KNR4 family protein [Planctomycetota bacterium]MCA8937815.1 SMI1/KNR4 family protein [Planctomycetota bacterium]
MSFADEFRAVLCPGMSLPNEFEQLFNWLERSGRVVEHHGVRHGEAPRGAEFYFMPEGNQYLHHWFGTDDPKVIGRVSIIARTGADGSMAGIWLDGSGGQKFVHLGSGSGSTLTCVLAADPVDFLRLTAIGYDELCWPFEFDTAPSADGDVAGVDDPEYREWVTSTFSVEIPETASEIVKQPDEMQTKEPRDEFCRWLAAIIDKP